MEIVIAPTARHVTVLLDDDAASALRHAEYSRETYRHKPPWQHL
jgi:hypothetical protein